MCVLRRNSGSVPRGDSSPDLTCRDLLPSHQVAEKGQAGAKKTSVFLYSLIKLLKLFPSVELSFLESNVIEAGNGCQEGRKNLVSSHM